VLQERCLYRLSIFTPFLNNLMQLKYSLYRLSENCEIVQVWCILDIILFLPHLMPNYLFLNPVVSRKSPTPTVIMPMMIFSGTTKTTPTMLSAPPAHIYLSDSFTVVSPCLGLVHPFQFSLRHSKKRFCNHFAGCLAALPMPFSMLVVLNPPGFATLE
jgi:hypothetical protein